LRDRVFHRYAADGHIVFRGEDGHLFEFLLGLARQRRYVADGLEPVAEGLYAHRVLLVGGLNLYHVALNAKGPAMQRHVVAYILHIGERHQKVAPYELLTYAQLDGRSLVGLRRPYPVYARYAGDDHNVAAGEQGARGLQAQAVDLVVYHGGLGDVGVRARYVGFGLIIIVKADEVLHGVVREELLELLEQLRREGLVVGDDECGQLRPLYDVGHGEGLARSGHPEQHLVSGVAVYAVNDLVDGLGLVAGGCVGAVQLKFHSENRFSY